MTLPPLEGNPYRDCWCGEPRSGDEGRTVRVAGWIHRRRDHGGLVFVDLRDRTGLLQLVFDPDRSGEVHDRAGELRTEDVVSVSGEVVRRSAETINPQIATGEVELWASELEVLADADTPPFGVESFSGEAGEEARLRHRYIDLRREPMQEAIALRHRVTTAIRQHLDEQGFLEIETPILTRSTPEGARDFLVPSRLQPGTFYALPQSPQLFKQLLMCAGFERYFQIARCFRDEDFRADRQPDFTQLDLEMSFVGVDDVIAVNERLLAAVFDAVVDPEARASLPGPPYPRLSYDDAIERFGTDRPDTRFGLELVDLTDALRETEFKVFRGAIEAGGTVRGLNAGARDLPRSALDGLIARAQELGAKGLVWAFREGVGWRSPTAKFLSDSELAELNRRLGAEEGDLLLLVADSPRTSAEVLGFLRVELAQQFGLVPEVEELVWIVDWPMFERDEETGRWDPLHHPFTSPAGAIDPEDPGAARALAYDIVWNGQEIGGGSIRINRPDVQRQVFGVLGISEEEAEARFGFLLEALRFGAPPHGGIAYGLDRFVQRLLHRESIRDVIAFPKVASGADPLTGAPAPVDEIQLRELGIRLGGKK